MKVTKLCKVEKKYVRYTKVTSKNPDLPSNIVRQEMVWLLGIVVGPMKGWTLQNGKRTDLTGSE